METQEPLFTAALVSSIGGVHLLTDPERSIQMNRRTGDAHDLLPGTEYVPLTTELAKEYGRSGYDVVNVDGELKIKIGGTVLNLRSIELVSE